MVFPPACDLHLLLPARGLHEDDHLQELQAFLLEPLLFGNCRVTLSIRFNVSLLGKSPAAYGGWSERLSCRCDRSVDPKGGAFFVPPTIIMKMLFLFLRQLDRANLSGNHVVSLYFWPNAKTKISGETGNNFNLYTAECWWGTDVPRYWTWILQNPPSRRLNI